MKAFRTFTQTMTGRQPLLRTVLVWALVLAVGAFVLQWLQYEYLVRLLPPQIYIAIIGTAFAAGGVRIRCKLTAQRVESAA